MIALIVVLVMLLQFIVCAMHQFSASALYIWAAGRHLMDKAMQGFGALLGV